MNEVCGVLLISLIVIAVFCIAIGLIKWDVHRKSKTRSVEYEGLEKRVCDLEKPYKYNAGDEIKVRLPSIYSKKKKEEIFSGVVVKTSCKYFDSKRYNIYSVYFRKLKTIRDVYESEL